MVAKREPLVISGRVRDPGGDPVKEARVYFTEGPVSFPDIAALTDDEGRFSLTAPAPGTYILECRAEGFAPKETAVTVPPSGQILDVRVSKVT